MFSTNTASLHPLHHHAPPDCSLSGEVGERENWFWVVPLILTHVPIFPVKTCQHPTSYSAIWSTTIIHRKHQMKIISKNNFTHKVQGNWKKCAGMVILPGCLASADNDKWYITYTHCSTLWRTTLNTTCFSFYHSKGRRYLKALERWNTIHWKIVFHQKF